MSLQLGIEPFQKFALGGGGGWWSKGILGFQTLGLDLTGTKLNNIFSWAVVNSTQVELVTSKLVQVAS